jgi:hypothetical protein
VIYQSDDLFGFLLLLSFYLKSFQVQYLKYLISTFLGSILPFPFCFFNDDITIVMSSRPYMVLICTIFTHKWNVSGFTLKCTFKSCLTAVLSKPAAGYVDGHGTTVHCIDVIKEMTEVRWNFYNLLYIDTNACKWTLYLLNLYFSTYMKCTLNIGDPSDHVWSSKNLSTSYRAVSLHCNRYILYTVLYQIVWQGNLVE